MRRLRHRLGRHAGRLALAALVVLALVARAHVHADEPSAPSACHLCTVAHQAPLPVAPPLAVVAPLFLVTALAPLACRGTVASRAGRVHGRAPPAPPHASS